MAREAILQIDCSDYSDKIMDVMDLFCKVGWKYYNAHNCVEFTPVGDVDDFDWQSEALSNEELRQLVDEKQVCGELVAVNLYYENSEQGITFMAKDTKEIILGLNINRKTMENHRDSITDMNWYTSSIVQKLMKHCKISHFQLLDYEG